MRLLLLDEEADVSGLGGRASAVTTTSRRSNGASRAAKQVISFVLSGTGNWLTVRPSPVMTASRCMAGTAP
ncbi:hypothetical protein ABZX75_33590 [Streptomyces sp. NPDC003038]|uniref:hypothetical protein n=1 Tax=Streptomyces sp. NPDC003038 TaxID=3154546 RepID=UPI0033BB0C64